MGISRAVLQPQILDRYDPEYIQQTLEYCLKYFKHTAVKHKSGFLIKALKDGFFKEEMQSTESRKQKQRQAAQDQDQQKAAQELETAQKEELLQQLRKQYQTPELIEQVLSELQGNRFIYPIAEEKRRQGMVNKYLQAFIDKKLREEYGESSFYEQSS